MPQFVYLHGFLSSPRSLKAQQTLRYCQAADLSGQIHIPSLKKGPGETIKDLEAMISRLGAGRCGLIGSSLGGYYATCLAEKFSLPAVLVNPAVRPFEFLDTHVGTHKNYYDEDIQEVTSSHIQELADLYLASLGQPQNYLVLLQTGDEVLDYRQATERYRQASLVVHEGGNHSYENFAAELPAIFEFLLSRIA